MGHLSLNELLNLLVCRCLGIVIGIHHQLHQARPEVLQQTALLELYDNSICPFHHIKSEQCHYCSKPCRLTHSAAALKLEQNFLTQSRPLTGTPRYLQKLGDGETDLHDFPEVVAVHPLYMLLLEALLQALAGVHHAQECGGGRDKGGNLFRHLQRSLQASHPFRQQCASL